MNAQTELTKRNPLHAWLLGGSRTAANEKPKDFATNTTALIEYSPFLKVFDEQVGSEQPIGLLDSFRGLTPSGITFDIGSINPLNTGLLPMPLRNERPWQITLTSDWTESRPALGYTVQLGIDRAAIQVPSSPLGNPVFASAIEQTFALANWTEFEDGIENEFTRRLANLVKAGGSLLVEQLGIEIRNRNISPSVVAQTVLCVSRINDQSTLPVRSQFVRRALRSSSDEVRDAAAIGIATMKDTLAQDDLAAAIDQENNPELKVDMESVMSYLLSTK